MIIEKFKAGTASEVYRRFKERGRMVPDGLNYISSWVKTDLSTCYQVMETGDPGKLDQWMDQWKDLVEFEVVPVITSAKAGEAAGK